MASSKEVIELLFNAEYAGKAEVRALKRDLNELAGDFGNGISTVSAYTVALAGIEATAIAASIGLAKAGAEAAGNFNAGFAEISTLVTATDEDLAAFKRQIQDYASTSTASFADINGAIYNAISAGVDYKDSIQFLSNAEKLSVAGKTDLNSAVQVLTGTLSAYGEETSKAGEYSDVLFATVKNGVTTVPELVSSLGGITGTAAALGVSFEEISASVATLTKSGVGTSEAMTALKAAISNIIKPTKEAQEIADKYGISLGTSALESKGFAGVMEEIALKTGGSKEEISKLFGSTEALNAVLALTSEQGLKTFKADLDAVSTATGSTEQAFKKMADNVDLIKQTLSNNIEGTLIAIGEPILDEFKDIDKAITDIFSTIRSNLTDSDGALVPVIDAVEGVAETVARIIRSMADNMDQALNMSDLSGFTGAFDRLNNALKTLELDKPEGLASAIEAIGKAFDGLTNFTVEAGKVLAEMLGYLGDLAEFLKKIDADMISTAGSIGGWALALTAASAPLSALLAILLAMKQLGGLPGAFGKAADITKTAGAMGTLSSAVAKIGVGGAALAGGFLAGGAAVEYFDEKTGLLTGRFKENQIAGESLTQALENFRKETGNANATIDDYIAAMKDKHGADSQAVSDYEKGKSEAEAWFKANENLATTIKTVYTEEEKRRANIAKLAITTDEATGKLIKNEEALAALKAGNLDLAESILGIATASQNTANSVSEVGKAAQDLATGSNKAKNEVNALKSAADILKNGVSSIKDLDAFFDFQSEKAKAAAAQFTALGDSAKSTGDAIAAAFGQSYDLNTFEGVFAQNEKERQIDEMIEQNGKLTDAQAELAKARAAMIREQTGKLAAGDALISIDGTNLEPQLEAFMFEILKSIQMRVSADQADFLLGVP